LKEQAEAALPKHNALFEVARELHSQLTPSFPAFPSLPTPQTCPSLFNARSIMTAAKRPPANLAVGSPHHTSPVGQPGSSLVADEDSTKNLSNPDANAPAVARDFFKPPSTYQSASSEEQLKLEVQQWLHHHRLLQYEEQLKSIGGESLDFLQFLQMPDMDGLSIPVLHKRALVAWASQIGRWRSNRVQ